MVEGLCILGTDADTDCLDGKLHLLFLCKPGASSDQSTAVNESRQSAGSQSAVTTIVEKRSQALPS